MKFLVNNILFFAVILISFLIFAFVVQQKFEKEVKTAFYNNPEKVWAHRGYCEAEQDNSLESYEAAFDLGAKGTELDIHFDLKTNEFIVSHEYPYALHDGSVLMLEEVFEQFGNDKYYWLDLKKLSKLSRKETQLAAQKLSELIAKNNLQNHCIVEGQKASKLGVFARAGIPTSFWIGLKEKDSFLEFFIEKTVVLFQILKHDFSAVSMRYKYYTPKVEKTLKGMPVHLFTVNDERELRMLVEKSDVRIILTDNNLYGIE